MLTYNFFRLLKSACVNVWFDSMALPISLLWVASGMRIETNCAGSFFGVDVLVLHMVVLLLLCSFFRVPICGILQIIL